MGNVDMARSRIRNGHFIMPSLKSLGIDQLSVEERIALAEEIWESIEAEQHPPLLTPKQRQELGQRFVDHEADPGAVVSWDEIRSDAMKRFSS